jgi:CRISPR system Cascade subunit CasE
MTGALHVVRLVLDRREAARVATRHGLPSWVDDGYFLHAALSQLFSTSSERVELPLLSFAVDDRYAEVMQKPELLYVLAYANERASALELRMGEARDTLLRGFDSKEVPSVARGQRAEFRVRVCPIVRSKIAGEKAPTLDKKGRPRSRELDAFVHQTLVVGREQKVSREDVYSEWLSRSAAIEPGACSFDEARLVEFRREVMRRRGREDAGRIERPNAVLEGTLTVGDPDAFARLLARGIGRHRAFGFGMLLLKPAR